MSGIIGSENSKSGIVTPNRLSGNPARYDTNDLPHRRQWNVQQTLFNGTNLSAADLGHGTPTTEVPLTRGAFRNANMFYPHVQGYASNYNNGSGGPTDQYAQADATGLSYGPGSGILSILGKTGQHTHPFNWFGVYHLHPSPNVYTTWDLGCPNPSVRWTRMTGRITWGTGTTTLIVRGCMGTPRPQIGLKASPFDASSWTTVYSLALSTSGSTNFDSGWTFSNINTYQYYCVGFFGAASNYDYGLDNTIIYGDYY